VQFLNGATMNCIFQRMSYHPNARIATAMLHFATSFSPLLGKAPFDFREQSKPTVSSSGDATITNENGYLT